MNTPLSHDLMCTFQRRTLLTFTLLTLTATAATAQDKITGDGKCGKPDKQEAVDVGDRTGHALVLVKFSCTWTRPIEMAGLKAKDYVGTVTGDVWDGKEQDRGYVVVTMDNGDKAFIRFSGNGTIAKDGATAGEGTWSYTGGTGKLRGLTGKGTYKSSGNADGAQDHVEGEYDLAPSSSTKTKK